MATSRMAAHSVAERFGDAVATRLLLRREFSCAFGDVERNRRRCSLKLLRQVRAAARQVLHDVVGQSVELDGGPVNVELVVIERVLPPIVAVSGTGTGTGTKGP